MIVIHRIKLIHPQDIIFHPQDITHRIKIYPVGNLLWILPVDDVIYPVDKSCGRRNISCGYILWMTVYILWIYPVGDVIFWHKKNSYTTHPWVSSRKFLVAKVVVKVVIKVQSDPRSIPKRQPCAYQWYFAGLYLPWSLGEKSGKNLEKNVNARIRTHDLQNKNH